MNTCGACAHHRMTGPLAVHGFGLCAVRPDPDKRAAITTPAQALCRIGLFEEKKQTASFFYFERHVGSDFLLMHINNPPFLPGVRKIILVIGWEVSIPASLRAHAAANRERDECSFREAMFLEAAADQYEVDHHA